MGNIILPGFKMQQFNDFSITHDKNNRWSGFKIRAVKSEIKIQIANLSQRAFKL